MTIADRIEINPGVMLGKPVIRDTRIPVELIIRKLSEVKRLKADLLDAYPRLTRGHICAALAYAAGSRAHEINFGTACLMATKSLLFLADESCDFAVVRAFRADEFDV